MKADEKEKKLMKSQEQLKVELELADLKVAVQKAITDLAATKGISKSRRFAEIREDLEAAMNPEGVRQARKFALDDDYDDSPD